jgi:hypothetical protein
MLAEIESRDFDEWMAFRRIEPDPLDRIAEILKIGFATLCAVNGAEIEPDKFESPQKRIDDNSDKQQVCSPRAIAGKLREKYS